MTRVKQVTAAVTNEPRKRNLQRADVDPLPRRVPGTGVILGSAHPGGRTRLVRPREGWQAIWCSACAGLLRHA